MSELNESARLVAAENALRSLASWLGVGGYNAPEVDAKVFEEKIRCGVNDLLRRTATVPLGYKAMPIKALRKIGVLIEAPWTDAAAPDVLRRLRKEWSALSASSVTQGSEGASNV